MINHTIYLWLSVSKIQNNLQLMMKFDEVASLVVIKRSVTIGKIRKSLIHIIEYFTSESQVEMLTIWPVR